MFKLAILEGRLSSWLKELNWKLQMLLSVPILLLLPPFLTHIFPAMVLYGWILLPLSTFSMLAIMMCGGLLIKKENRIYRLGLSPNLQRYFFRFVVEIFMRFLVVFLLQTLFNYSAIFYEGISTGQKSPSLVYMEAFRRDYHLRSQSYCFFETAHQRADQLVLLFSFI